MRCSRVLHHRYYIHMDVKQDVTMRVSPEMTNYDVLPSKILFDGILWWQPYVINYV